MNWNSTTLCRRLPVCKGILRNETTGRLVDTINGYEAGLERGSE
jgi:hypothetical protein